MGCEQSHYTDFNCGVSLVEQDTIENVSYPIKNTFYYFLREKNKLHLMQPFSVDATMFSKKSF